MNASEREKATAPLLLRYFSRLRFPWLFAVTALLFGIDLLVPDVFPFVDELLLGLTTLLLGAWRRRKNERTTSLPLDARTTPTLPPPEERSELD